jgi:dienelactone hydrolase
MSFPARGLAVTLTVALVQIAATLALAQNRDAPTLQSQTVEFPSADRARTPLKGLLVQPSGPAGKRPVVVMLHGCGGLFSPSGRVLRREVDWASRFQAAGYNVLLVDSFGSRNLGAQCTNANRTVFPVNRARDTQGAIDWLATQAWADARRVAVIGWSHGGSTTLHYVRAEFAPQGEVNIRAAIAIYPGCRVLLDRTGPRPGVPLEIHMGSADDWTPPEPCQDLARTWSVPITMYPDAHHGFDAPNVPVRVRTGLVTSKNGDGRAHVGTHPEGRERLIAAVMARLQAVFAAP